MDLPKPKLTNHTALRVVKNEALLCQNCLSSSSGPNEETVYCHFNSGVPEVKNRDQFCVQGLWLIDGEVLDFKTGFQKIYRKGNTDIAGDKGINL